MYSKVFDDPSNYTGDKDLVMVLGDFNMNGAGLTKASMQKLEEASKEVLFKPILPLLRNEYKSLVKALSPSEKGQQYKLIDCAREGPGEGRSGPITFADVKVDADGNEMPLNPELFSEKDYMTKQSLDYIFVLEPIDTEKESKKNESEGEIPIIKGNKRPQICIKETKIE